MLFVVKFIATCAAAFIMRRVIPAAGFSLEGVEGEDTYSSRCLIKRKVLQKRLKWWLWECLKKKKELAPSGGIRHTGLKPAFELTFHFLQYATDIQTL